MNYKQYRTIEKVAFSPMVYSVYSPMAGPYKFKEDSKVKKVMLESQKSTLPFDTAGGALAGSGVGLFLGAAVKDGYNKHKLRKGLKFVIPSSILGGIAGYLANKHKAKSIENAAGTYVLSTPSPTPADGIMNLYSKLKVVDRVSRGVEKANFNKKPFRHLGWDFRLIPKGELADSILKGRREI